MSLEPIHQERRRLEDRQRLDAWSLKHAMVLVMGLAVALWFDAAWPLSVIALASFGFYFAINQHLWRPLKPLGGYANWVTVGRLLGVLTLGVWAPDMPNLIVGLITVALVTADGLDGYVARKHGTESAFGAHLDMETDALFLCMLTALSYFLGLLPGIILFIGYTRYIYVLAMAMLQVSDKPAPRSLFNRVVAVTIQYSMAAVFILPAVIHLPALVIASGLLLFSFGRSTYYVLSSD